MADDGENMFGRDSDSDSSEEADVGEAAVNTEENTAPARGGAAGGFLRQVDNVEKTDAGSGSGGGSGGGGSGTDAALPTEGKAREGEEEDQAEDSPPSQAQGGAQPKKTLPRPAYKAIATFEELDLPAALLEGVKLMGFVSKPSAIQASTLPAICRPMCQGGGYTNVVAQAKAGSGKTVAMVVGMLSRVDLTREVTQCVFLCNTREAMYNVRGERERGEKQGR